MPKHRQISHGRVGEAVEWIINDNGVTLADGKLYSDVKTLPAGELKVIKVGLGAIEPVT